MNAKRTKSFLSVLAIMLYFSTAHGAAKKHTIIATIPLGGLTQHVAVNPHTNLIYVVNLSDDNVSVIDGSDNTVVATIPVGDVPRSVGINLNTNRIYVTNYESDTISVIDGFSNSVMQTIPFDIIGSVAVNSKTNRVYVRGGSDNNHLSVIEGVNNTVIDDIYIGCSLRDIAINEVANLVYTDSCGDILAIDGNTNTVIDSMAVGSDTMALGVNPTLNRIYAADYWDDSLYVIDGSTKQIIDNIPTGYRPSGSGIAINSIANLVYVVNNIEGRIYIIDSTNDSVIDTISVGYGLSGGIDANPHTGRIYVTGEDSLAVLAPIENISIVDNADAQFSKVGYWRVSDKCVGYYGTDYRYAYAGDGSAVATFTFQIPADGNYQIAAQWPAHISRATDAPYTIINNGRIIDTILVDQRANGGRFNPLTGPAAIGTGVYPLNAGILEVNLSNDASGKVAADAVMAGKIPDPTKPYMTVVDNADADLDDGLVAYYSFSGNANDKSCNGNHGTVVGATLTGDRFGNADSAYSFDGMDDYIEVPSLNSFLFSELTFSVWLKIPDIGINNRRIFTIYGGDGHYYALQGNSVNALSLKVDDEEVNEYDWAFIPNRWTYIAMTYDGHTLKVYKDGVMTESGIIDSDPVNGPLLIGETDPDTADRSWLGALDDIRINNRVLSEDEIKTHFSKVGYWRVSDKCAGYYGTDYRYAYAGDGSAVATFTFQIPADGNYQITAQWPAHISRATDAPYTIINNGRIIDTILVDQRANGGRFNPLTGPAAIGTGVYPLNAGMLEVNLSNDANGKVAADAVMVSNMAGGSN